MNKHALRSRPEALTTADRPSWVRIAAFGGSALVLVWLILTRSLASYLAATAPSAALFLRSDEPTALVALAEQEVDAAIREKAKTAGQADAQATLLRRLGARLQIALAADPLNAHAYRLLGQLAEAEKSDAQAIKFMEAAARHSLGELFAVEWMMRKSFENKNYAAAAYYADVFLSARPQLISYAAPILGRMAENSDAKAEVQKLLAANPHWRWAFFQALDAAVTDARTPLALLFALQDTPAPPTAGELGAYLSFLFQHKFYGLAYYAWLQFLPPEQLEHAGFLFNGSFETKPSGMPFDWAMPPGSGVKIAIAPRPGTPDKHALLLEFTGGRADFAGVYQTTALPPGAYRLRGSFRGELAGRRGMQWVVSCMDGPALGASQMMLGAAPAWREFEFLFTVPESGCSAQSVRLALAARSASEQLVSGSIWFDELSISRQAGDPAK